MDALNHYQESEVPHMSGRFMTIKRIVIPTITMVIIASQLMGCAAVTQSELLLSCKLDAPAPCRLDAPDFSFVCHVLADCLHQHWQAI